MTFGDIFSEINLDSSIIDVIILTNLMFLAFKFGVPTLNIKWSVLYARDINEMSKIVTNQKDLNFGRRKTLRKSTIAFNYRIIDGHIEIPYCMLLFDKSNKNKSIKPETAVTWSKSNLNMMNIYEESTINFWICGRKSIKSCIQLDKSIFMQQIHNGRYNKIYYSWYSLCQIW